MPKRPNPFGDASPLQIKTHIGPKEIDMGVNQEKNMSVVYGKFKLTPQSSAKPLTSHWPCVGKYNDQYQCYIEPIVAVNCALTYAKCQCNFMSYHCKQVK